MAPDVLYDRYATLNLENALGKGSCGYAYLRARIRCAEAGEYLWLLNSDDSATVWLDGSEVIANPHNAPAEGFLVRLRKPLAAGDHVLLARVFQAKHEVGDIYEASQNYWKFRLRVRLEPHTPAPIVGMPG